MNKKSSEAKILILHLSDIHFKSKDNPFVEKIPYIEKTLKSYLKEYAGCFVVISGDVAFSGCKKEYEFGFDLVASLDEIIRNISTISTHEFLVVPGNHDCDFSSDDKTRAILLDNLLNKPDNHDGAMIQNCIGVQDEFFEFKYASFDKQESSIQDKLFSTRCFNVAGEKIVFDLFNTAWLSRLKEQVGQLLGPPDTYFSDSNKDDESALRVSVLHHPLHWIKPETSREFRSILEASSDLIFTGHEHTQSQYSRFDHGEKGADYIEGGVLQETGDPEKSAFNIVEISLGNRSFEVDEWAWGNGKYQKSNKGELQPFRRTRADCRRTYSLTDSFFNNYLKNSGAQFSHPRKDSIDLDDLYTAPDFRRFGAKDGLKSSDSHTISGTRAFGEIDLLDAVVISGNENVGKTSAIKNLYWKAYSSALLPIVVSGKSLKDPKENSLEKVIKKAFCDQYDSKKKFEDYKSENSKIRVVFIDDFHESPLNIEGRIKTLKWFGAFFGKVVVVGDDALRVEQLSGNKKFRELFEGFKHYQILEFGYLLRRKLISRWILIGGQDYLDDHDYSAELKMKSKIVSSILGKNVVPAFPLFILVILQQMEAGTSNQTATGSFGYFYETLITESLSSVIEPKDVDTYYNLIAELSFELYGKSTRNIRREDFDTFISSYNDVYQLTLNPRVVEKRLVAARILFERGRDALRFQYKYVYYYFIARHASHNLNPSQQGDLVQKCVTLIHTERAANILIFLTYLSRNPNIINSLLIGARKNYAGVIACDFDSHVARISTLQHKIPQFIVPEGDPDEHHEEALALSDAASTRTDATGLLAHEDDNQVDFDDQVDEILALNRAFKSMQVLGQIVRNFSGSLKGGLKFDLANECVSLGLRSINYLFEILQENLKDVVSYVQTRISSKNSELESSVLEERSRSLIFFLCENAASGLVRRIVTDVGSPDLTLTYDHIVEKNPTPSFELVRLAIKIDQRAEFPADEVIALAEKYRKNLFVKSLICQLVTTHFYLFRVPSPIRQRVCKKLDIGISENAIQRQDSKRLEFDA